MAWAIPLAMMAAGVAGGALGKKSSKWSGTKPHLEKFQNLNHNQRTLLSHLVRHADVNLPQASKNPLFKLSSKSISNLLNQKSPMPGQQYLESILNQDIGKLQEQFAAPYKRQFQEEVLPGIAERFSAMGPGAQQSSAFAQSLGTAGAGLQEKLAALGGQLGLQNRQMGMNAASTLGQMGLQRQGLGLQAAGMGMNAAQVPFSEALQNQQLNLQRYGLGLGTQPYGYMNMGGQPGIGQGLSGGLMQGGSQALSLMAMLKMFGGG